MREKPRLFFGRVVDWDNRQSICYMREMSENPGQARQWLLGKFNTCGEGA